MIEMWKIDACAHAAHEAVRAYAKTTAADGDLLANPWDHCDDAARAAARATVYRLIDCRSLTPEQAHEVWVASMVGLGWKKGRTKNVLAKTHPCLVEWDDLDHEIQAKDALFLDVAKAMLRALLSQPE